jgi:hypothetical protein
VEIEGAIGNHTGIINQDGIETGKRRLTVEWFKIRNVRNYEPGNNFNVLGCGCSYYLDSFYFNPYALQNVCDHNTCTWHTPKCD